MIRYRGAVALLAIALALPGLAARGMAAQGSMALAVDLTDAPRGVLHARMQVPTTGGPLTLLYPKWIPGEHSPSGPVQNLAGITIAAGKRVLAWRRDPEEMFAIHCDVPTGVR
ncbi:MAG: M61 family metallopeptidase, partial [Candidatus Eiseniibacteriota bacterium]